METKVQEENQKIAEIVSGCVDDGIFNNSKDKQGHIEYFQMKRQKMIFNFANALNKELSIKHHI